MNRETNSGERRKQHRLSVFSFLHATATLTEQTQDNLQAKNWTGLLEDISYDGAKVRMPLECRNHLRENQQMDLVINTTFIENISLDLNVLVKYVNHVENENNICIGILFTGLEKNPRARDKILQLCEYGKKLRATEIASAGEPSA